MTPDDNKQRREELEGELLEFLYGCHSDPADLERRLADDAELRALLEEVKSTKDMLDSAARSDAGALELTPPVASRPDLATTLVSTLAKPQRSATWRIAAGFLLALLASVPWLWVALRASHTNELESQYLRLVVSAPTGVPDGAPARLRVETWDLDGAPGAATVSWRAFDADGKVLERGEQPSDGAVDLDLPANLAGLRRVEVKAQRAGNVRTAEISLAPNAGAPLAHLATDKPAYRPGETVLWRAVVLDRLALTPREGWTRLRVVDPKGAPVEDWRLKLEEGVVATAWHVPDDAAGGEYALELRDVEDEFTVERLPLLVRRFQPPRLAKRVDLDRETYAPGENGAAELTVERVEGGVAVGAAVDATLVIDGAVVWREAGELDSDGKAVFSFRVPDAVERGEARFVARVTDGGVVESAIEPFVVPTGAVLVDFYPEGGELVAGVRSRVYAEVFDALDRPTSASGRIVDSRGREVATFETLHQGRARFELTPRAGVSYSLELEEPVVKSVPLPSFQNAGVALRADSDSVGAGEALDLTVHTPSAGPWIAGVFCRGVLVAQDTFQGAGDHELGIDVPDDIAGVLRVTVFDETLAPLAERLVHKESGRALRVAVSVADESTLPGAHQVLDVFATDETGRPVAATLGFAVSDRAVRDMVGDARVGLADQTWLAADVEELEDAAEFFSGDEAWRTNVDLLLGTRGWRRFAWHDPAALLAEHGDSAKRLLLREGRVDQPQVSDQLGEVPAMLWSARSDLDDARERAIALSVLALVLLAIYAVGRVPVLGRLPGVRVAFGLGLLLFFAANYLRSKPAVGFLAEAEMPMAQFAADAAAIDALELGDVAGEDPRVHLMALGYAADEADGAWAKGFGVEKFGAQVRRAGIAGADAELFGDDGRGAGAGGGGNANEREARGLFRFFEAQDKNLELAGEDPDQVGFARFQKPMRPQTERVYAHKRAPRAADAPRVDFTETVYWNGLLKTAADGTARVEFDLSDSVTTWHVAVDAHGASRVGQALAGFEAVTPFRLQAKLPVELSEGDRLFLPVAVTSGDASTAVASLGVALQGPLRMTDTVASEVELFEGRGRAFVPLEVTGSAPGAAIAFVGSAAGWTDRVGRQLRVVPRGFPHRVSKSGKVRDSVEFTIAMPDRYVDGSLSAGLKLYPSPLAGLLEGLEGILQEPYGCFEQASATNYPNILAAAYLDAAGIEAPAAMARARGLMEKGYAKLVGYECPELGYEWFGGDPGHEALTAYGLLEFYDMAQVYDVDDAMLERTRAWLLERRDGEGGFERNARALDSFGAAPAEVTDAYCTYALVLSGEPPETVEPELDRLESRALESDDAYEVALAAAALEVAGRRAPADAARNRLKAMQADDGKLVGTTKSITSSRGNDLAVETTSLALLAWLADADDEAHVQRALEWLLAQRQGNGRFGATQATIQALRALTEYARMNRRIANAGEIVVYVNDFEVERLAFEAGQRGALEIEGLAEHLSAGTNRVRLELTGGNEFPWALDLAYYAEVPASAPNAEIEMRTQLARTVVEEGETVALNVEVENRSEEGQPMTLAIIGLPAGLEAPTSVLEDLADAGRFDLWEVRGREIVLYWRGLAPREVKEIALDLVARIPGETTGPASRAYPYYTPDAVFWAQPLAVEVAAAR